MKKIEMPTGGDPTGIPPTSEVKNKDILLEMDMKKLETIDDRTNFLITVHKFIYYMSKNLIRTLTIVKKGGINR